MPVRSAKPARSKAKRTSAWVWTLLVVLVVAAGGLALNISQRFRRVTQATNVVKSVVQEAAARESILVKTPARKEFSSAFLQMAFGDNPPLLEKMREALSQAVGGEPALAQGDIAMMLVTYRAEGDLRDVAIQIFGNLNPTYLPRFSTDGYWRSQLTDKFYNLGQLGLSFLGRDLLILATRDVEKRQRELYDAALKGDYEVVRNHLQDPVSFIAVIPDPSKLFTEEFRPYVAVVLFKGKVSLDAFRVEMVALSYDSQKARELAQMLSDLRLMAVGLGRLRGGGFRASTAGLNALTAAQVQADGPTVTVSAVLPKEFLDRGLSLAVSGLARGIGRIKRGPGYPQ